jgi:hypothetical protein
MLQRFTMNWRSTFAMRVRERSACQSRGGVSSARPELSAGKIRQQRRQVEEWPGPAGRSCRASVARCCLRSHGLNQALVVEPEAQCGARYKEPPAPVLDTRGALNRLIAATRGRMGSQIASALSTPELILSLMNVSLLCILS